jgi:subtilisin-like proprotein convertase family protein
MLRFLLILLTFLSGSFKTFSQTFNGVGGLPFPPSGTTGVTQSQNPVSGVGVIGGCTYIDNVTINLDHTWVGDIALLLIAPNGTFIELSSGNGGPANNYTNTVFTDSAPLNIIDGSPPYTGNFQPEGRQNSTLTNPYPNTSPPGTFTFANTFNGVNADGNWILYLNDYVAGDFGTLNSWSITFVNGGTAFTVDLGPDQIVCAGDDVTLSANNTASTPTYLWSNGSANPTLEINNIGATSTFTVTVTDASGCTATDQVLITVNPSPPAFQCRLVPVK